MSKLDKWVNVRLPNDTVVLCRACTCAAEADDIKVGHSRHCELYCDYTRALTDEMVYGDDTPPETVH